jgi:hypothetical protein
MEEEWHWINLIWLCFLRIVKEPTTYEEAINSEQKEDQIKWKNAIDKELK